MTESAGILLADIILARRVESADAAIGLESAEIHARLHPGSGARAEAIGGGYAAFVGAGSPLTQAIGMGMQGSVTVRDIARLEQFFHSRGALCRIELCPLADASLPFLLSERGYRLTEFSNMMVRRLRTVEPPVRVEPGVSVQLCTPEEADVWARTVARGFGEDLLLSDENLQALKSLVLRSSAKGVLAWHDGRPAGGGALSVQDGIAAIYGASTLPSHRRQGIQTAVLGALITFAVNAECDLAYTLTRPGSISQRNLERRGFRVAYTRCTMVEDTTTSPGETQHS